MSRSSPPAVRVPAPRASSKPPSPRRMSELEGHSRAGAEKPRGVGVQRIFGLGVQVEDPRLAAGRPGDLAVEVVLGRRLQGGGAHQAGHARDVRSTLEATDQRGDPALVDPHVIIGVGDDLASRFGQPAVAGAGQTRTGFQDVPEPLVGADLGDERPVGGVIGRRVVDDDDLEVVVLQRLEAHQAFVDFRTAIPGADHDADPDAGVHHVAALQRTGRQQIRLHCTDTVDRQMGVQPGTSVRAQPGQQRVDADPAVIDRQLDEFQRFTMETHQHPGLGGGGQRRFDGFAQLVRQLELGAPHRECGVRHLGCHAAPLVRTTSGSY